MNVSRRSAWGRGVVLARNAYGTIGRTTMRLRLRLGSQRPGAKDAVPVARAAAGEPGMTIRVVDGREAAVRDVDRSLAPHPYWRPETISRPLPATFVVEVPRGRLIGASGHLLTSGRKVLLTDVSLVHPEQGFRTVEAGARAPSPTRRTEGMVAALATEWGHNYYHWMFDSLPRLELMRRAGVASVEIDLFAINRTPFPFQEDVWTRLGLDPDRTVALEAGDVLEADRVVATSSPRESWHARPWVHDFLRRTLLGAGTHRGSSWPERLYVSRGEADSRRLVNEPDCLDVLGRHGFETLPLDAMHVTEQAAAFDAARIVVGTHGAGLSNLVFCRPGTAVIELHSPSWPAPNFAELSRTRGCDYRYLMGHPVTARGVLASRLHLRSREDFAVDVGALDRLFAQRRGGVA